MSFSKDAEEAAEITNAIDKRILLWNEALSMLKDTKSFPDVEKLKDAAVNAGMPIIDASVLIYDLCMG